MFRDNPTREPDMKIGFISDIHEDELRLRESIRILESNCDRIVCLGDIIGYTVPYYGFLKSRNAHGCVQLVKEHCDIAVVGNHDLAAIGKLPRHDSDVRYPKDFYKFDLPKRTRLAKKFGIWPYENDLPAVIDKGDVRFLRRLPEYRVERLDGIRVLISHYGYPDLVGNLAKDIINPKDAVGQIEFQIKNKCTFGISGHDHSEGIRIFDKKQVRLIKFGSRVKIRENSWINCPCVANGTFANGVAVLDTEKTGITAIPLKTKRHFKPAWRMR